MPAVCRVSTVSWQRKQLALFGHLVRLDANTLAHQVLKRGIGHDLTPSGGHLVDDHATSVCSRLETDYLRTCTLHDHSLCGLAPTCCNDNDDSYYVDDVDYDDDESGCRLSWEHLSLMWVIGVVRKDLATFATVNQQLLPLCILPHLSLDYRTGLQCFGLQCFVAVGWVSGRASGP